MANWYQPYFWLAFIALIGLYSIKSLRLILLFLFNAFFYWYLAKHFFFILLLVATIDFLLGLWIAKSKVAWLPAGISVLIHGTLLFLFKYWNFFTGYTTPEIFQWFTPIGISYFAFRSLTYTLGLYHGFLEKPETDLLRYWVFALFFPVVLAGPIVSAAQLLPQLQQTHPPSKKEVLLALWYITTGFFKKLVIADYIAINFVERVFSMPSLYTGMEHALAWWGYMLQLFMDFCGYSDIAVGLALLLGFRIPHNFQEPFKSKGLIMFWRRWHITLAHWLRDYLYEPLSWQLRRWKHLGNALAIFFTFSLSGLWHGARWTFILWGIAHGIFLAIELTLRRWTTPLKKQRFFSLLSWSITIIFLWFTFALFNARSLQDFSFMTQQIFFNAHWHLFLQWFLNYFSVAITMIVATLLVFFPTTWKKALFQHWQSLPLAFQFPILILLLMGIFFLRSSEVLPFIYLQF